ncbi:MAG TPA: ankyrin repeat domain-containing protein [Saprospiraceae bacterium]|nr:ankyrin repeat domain-containing protein [Saprospiraceae bacterium]
MKLFEFKGDWEFEYQFEAFKGLQSRRGYYTSNDSDTESNGKVNVTIFDELNEDTEPTLEQINAIEYLIDNPDKIKQSLYKALEIEYPKFKEMYGYDENDEDSRKWFPKVNSIDEFKKVFGVGNLFILLPHKEGYSYIGLECGCTWDEEHGLGFLLHKDKIIKVGGADEAFSSWEAFKDNGTYGEEQNKWNEINTRIKPLPKPKQYEPNPKYGKLKPSQLDANKMFENHLIERGYNSEFIELVETNKIDINVNNGLTMTFLERAAQFNNLEIVKYILSKNPKSKDNVIHNSVGHCNKELVQIMIDNGIDINQPDQWGRTVLKLTEQKIIQYERSGNSELSKYMEFKNWLKLKGAN